MKAKKIWKRFCAWISELGDRAKLALVGFACCIRKPKYALAFALSFFLFYFFLTFFSDGTSNWSLLWSHISIEQKLSVLGHVSARMVTGLASLSGVCLALISLLQGAVIMLLIYNYRHREKSVAMEGIQNSGIASIISIFALGCPTCGISVLTPLLTAIAGASASMLVEQIGIIATILAFVLLIYTFIKLGFFVFIDITAKKHKEKHEKNS